MTTTVSYETLPNLKAALKITEATYDVTLQSFLDAATDYIDSACNRTFSVPSVAAEREYFVVDSTDLYVDDFIEPPTQVQIRYGASTVTLTSSQWMTIPRYLWPPQPSYQALRRLSGGAPVSWLFATIPGARVAITAKWAYSSQVPEPVVVACRMIAARMWQREVAGYGNDRGMAAGGLSIVQSPRDVVDSSIKTLLAQFKAVRIV